MTKAPKQFIGERKIPSTNGAITIEQIDEKLGYVNNHNNKKKHSIFTSNPI